MKKKDNFTIPADPRELYAWAQNFRLKLPFFAEELKLNKDEVDEAIEMCEMIIPLTKAVIDSEEEFNESIQEGCRDILSFLSNALGSENFYFILKNHRSFIRHITERSGFPYSARKDDTDLAPIIKVRAEHGKVKITYRKYGCQGISLYSYRKGDAEFLRLGKCYKNTYTDEREPLDKGLPEERYYTAMYFNQYGLIGDFSRCERVIIPPLAEKS